MLELAKRVLQWRDSLESPWMTPTESDLATWVDENRKKLVEMTNTEPDS